MWEAAFHGSLGQDAMHSPSVNTSVADSLRVDVCCPFEQKERTQSGERSAGGSVS